MTKIKENYLLVSRKIIFLLFIWIISTGALPGQVDKDGQSQPNIILIVSDDQGYGDYGFMGNDILKTPNLDQLSRESTRFNSFYVSPVCAPTRASLLTGRYHQRTGVIGVIEGREFMSSNEMTLAEILRKGGYYTGIIGKWHLGENYPMTPNAQGFDEFTGFLKGSSPYFDVTLSRNGTPYPTKGYLTDVLTDLAIEYIKENQDHPFFLYLPYNAPHTPLEVPDSYVVPYSELPHKHALVYGMIAALDQNIGRLMDALKETDLDSKTLVLYLSDNGMDGRGSAIRYNGGLKGMKYEVYEGGIRSPLIMHQPGIIPKGKIIETPIAHIDILPTLLEYANLPLPRNLKIDGKSFLPILKGDIPEKRIDRPIYISYPGEKGQRNRKPHPYPGGAFIKGPYKMVNGKELYNIESDPGETIELSKELPEVMEDLGNQYLGLWYETNTEGKPYPRVAIGYEEENPVSLSTHWALLDEGGRFQYSIDTPKYRDIGVHHDWISFENAKGKATWRIEVVKSADYKVSAMIAASATDARASFGLKAGKRTIITSIDSICQFKNGDWCEVKLANFPLPKGPVDLELDVSGTGGSVKLDRLILECQKKD